MDFANREFATTMTRWGKCMLAGATGLAIIAFPMLSQGVEDKTNWRNVEADNGAVYKIDLNSIRHDKAGAAEAMVYAVEGSAYNPENMHWLWFDCHGKFRDQTGRVGPVQYAPPRSIAGRLSDIACIGAKDTRLEELSRPQPPQAG